MDFKRTIIKTYSKKQPQVIYKSSAKIVPANNVEAETIRKSRINEKSLVIENFDDTFERLAHSVEIPKFKNLDHDGNFTRRKKRKESDQDSLLSESEVQQKKVDTTKQGIGVKKKRISSSTRNEKSNESFKEQEDTIIEEVFQNLSVEESNTASDSSDIQTNESAIICGENFSNICNNEYFLASTPKVHVVQRTTELLTNLSDDRVSDHEISSDLFSDDGTPVKMQRKNLQEKYNNKYEQKNITDLNLDDNSLIQSQRSLLDINYKDSDQNEKEEIDGNLKGKHLVLCIPKIDSENASKLSSVFKTRASVKQKNSGRLKKVKESIVSNGINEDNLDSLTKVNKVAEHILPKSNIEEIDENAESKLQKVSPTLSKRRAKQVSMKKSNSIIQSQEINDAGIVENKSDVENNKSNVDKMENKENNIARSRCNLISFVESQENNLTNNKPTGKNINRKNLQEKYNNKYKQKNRTDLNLDDNSLIQSQRRSLRDLSNKDSDRNEKEEIDGNLKEKQLVLCIPKIDTENVNNLSPVFKTRASIKQKHSGRLKKVKESIVLNGINKDNLDSLTKVDKVAEHILPKSNTEEIDENAESKLQKVSPTLSKRQAKQVSMKKSNSIIQSQEINDAEIVENKNDVENNISNVDKMENNIERNINNLITSVESEENNMTTNKATDKSINGEKLCDILSKLNDPVKITMRRNINKKWGQLLPAITEDQDQSKQASFVPKNTEILNVAVEENVSDNERLKNSLLEEHETNKSINLNQSQPIFLKPGKSWARSLSIINHFRNGQNLDELAGDRGQNWRCSVHSILSMQPEGIIPLNTTFNNRKTDETRDSNAQNITWSSIPIRNSVRKSIPTRDSIHNSISVRDSTRNSIPIRNSIPNSIPIRNSIQNSIPNSIPIRDSIQNSIYIPRESNFNSSVLITPPRHSCFSMRIIPSGKRSTLTDDYLQTQRGSSIANRTRRKFSKTETNTFIETEEDLIRSAKDIILKRCKQTSYIPFSDCFPDSYIDNCRKIGEGVYGEVFLYTTETEKSVIKIIPIEGEELVNCEPQKKFHEILSEIIISEELHKLRFADEYNTNGFVGVNRIMCVIGKYPDKLIDLWNIYDIKNKSENDCPSMFGDEQLYIILDLAHGGQDLEAYVFQDASESYSIFLQAAYSLAVAEQSLEFEHRDLHWGNVLISKTDDTLISYKLGSNKISLPIKKVQVTVIDFTLSRMSYQGCKIFNDLAADPTLFTAQGEYQFDIYRLMRDNVNNDWQQFKPYTNVLWLDYMLDKMIAGVRYKKKTTKIHKIAINEMKEVRKEILQYKSAFELVTNCEKIAAVNTDC